MLSRRINQKASWLLETTIRVWRIAKEQITSIKKNQQSKQIKHPAIFRRSYFTNLAAKKREWDIETRATSGEKYEISKKWANKHQSWIFQFFERK